jgi:phage protein D/phage baseplate assembly protein gpV
MPHFKNLFTVKIEGANVSELFYDSLQEIVVDTSLNMPGMFCIRLYDDGLTWIDSAVLDLGKQVEIGAIVDEVAGSTSNNTTTVLIKGEITALEPIFSAHGPKIMVVRGYDKSHRLHHGTQTRTFLQTKDSALAQKIAGEVGLTPEVDATTITYDFILQYNQTNYEFLKGRAEQIGYKMYVSDGKLFFKKGNQLPASASVTLKFLENMVSFEPRYTTAHQVNKMKVMGWDSKAKQLISSEKQPLSALNQGGLSTTGGSKAQSSFGDATAMIVDHPVDSAEQADALANGLSSEISLGFMQAEGECFGNPLVQAGNLVRIEGIGTRFSGKYLVTSAIHTYNTSGYSTHFRISGNDPETLISLVAPEAGSGQEQGLVRGVVTALVTNLQDPENRGRVKLKYPWLGDNIETDWTRTAVPMAGSGRGMMILPEVNDEALVAFDHGDIQHPYIVGFLWSNTDKPPQQNADAVANGKIIKRVFKTRQGHLVTFSDKDGEEQISLKSKSGHLIVLDDKSGSENITIKDKTGSNSMVIDSSKNSMTIKVAGDFSVEATGKIQMKSTGPMNLESTADAKMKGINVSVEGSAKSEVKGAMVSINGSANAELKGGAMVTVQGGLVKIN